MLTRVMTIKLRFATLIVLGFKKLEYRPGATKHRGRLLIHAGQASPVTDWDTPRNVAKALKAIQAAGFESFADLPRGFILGAVDVVGVKEYHDGEGNPFGWILKSPKRFRLPIPANGLGQLSMWSYDEVKRKKVKTAQQATPSIPLRPGVKRSTTSQSCVEKTTPIHIESRHPCLPNSAFIRSSTLMTCAKRH